MMPHNAPIGASNGTHDLGNPTCTPTMAMKNSDALSAMKQHLFGGNG
jgi:hypothetical protein